MPRPGRKRLLDWLALHLGVPLAYLSFRAIGATLRHRQGGRAREFREAVSGGQRFVVAFWHDDSFHLALEWRRAMRPEGNLYIMTSPGRDGELISRFLEKVGARVVRGSTTHGGGRALIGLLRAMTGRDFVALAVDGSRRCPRFTVQKGVLLLARRAGLAVLPVAARAKRRVVAGAHRENADRIEIPLPFGETEIFYGEPLVVAPNATESDLERLRADLEERLKSLKGIEREDEVVKNLLPKPPGAREN